MSSTSSTGPAQENKSEPLPSKFNCEFEKDTAAAMLELARANQHKRPESAEKYVQLMHAAAMRGETSFVVKHSIDEKARTWLTKFGGYTIEEDREYDPGYAGGGYTITGYKISCGKL